MGFFQFKQFIIHQDRCAMKVGTDGVLLGAWADGGRRILDIGTGTGLLALMMAQRFPKAEVTAVEMEEEACRQAEENIIRSPFAERITACHDTIQHFAQTFTSISKPEGAFDSIVCNPPYFENSLKNHDRKASLARHNDTLSWNDLIAAVGRLLANSGTFSVILPFDGYMKISEIAYIEGFKEYRSCKILTKEGKPCKRILAAFTKDLTRSFHSERQVLMNSDGTRSEWYTEITKDFYIR